MMQKVKTVAIVSLSSGVLGEDFVQHEVKIGLERLRRFGLEVKFMENALKGLDYLKEHPEKRAEDQELLRAGISPGYLRIGRGNVALQRKILFGIDSKRKHSLY